MLSHYQKTILKKVAFSRCRALHSGLKTEVKILPAAENHGIIFKRTDLGKNNTIKANFENVSSATLCTTLQNKFNVTVSTVEHLLAALYITGIDNALIEIKKFVKCQLWMDPLKNLLKLYLEQGLKKLEC